MDMEIVFAGGKKVDAVYKGFTVKTDQSESSGGRGSAPQPFDLFLASIGTCAGIYVLSYCQNHKIDADRIKLILRTETDRTAKLLSKVEIEIQLPLGFEERYKSALIKSAELCSVKRQFHDPPAFDIFTTTQKSNRPDKQ
jgi:putative redox protein